MSEMRDQKRAEAINHFRNQNKNNPDFYAQTPAVHPRYRSAYNKIYENEAIQQNNTFFIRFIISIILFAGFLNLDQPSLPSMLPKQNEIIQQVQASFNISVWKEFDLPNIL